MINSDLEPPILSNKPPLLKSLISWFIPVVIWQTSTEFNPLLKIAIDNGKYILDAKSVNYSFDTLHEAFSNTFNYLNIKGQVFKNALLLGLGAGSVPILLKEFEIDCHLTAVEIDPIIVNIAIRSFGLDSKNINIITADAFDFVNNSNEKYDLIIIDLFVDNIVPEKASGSDFFFDLHKILTNNGLLIYNRLVVDEQTREATESCFNALQNNFFEAEIYSWKDNKLIYVDKRPQS